MEDTRMSPGRRSVTGEDGEASTVLLPEEELLAALALLAGRGSADELDPEDSVVTVLLTLASPLFGVTADGQKTGGVDADWATALAALEPDSEVEGLNGVSAVEEAGSVVGAAMSRCSCCSAPMTSEHDGRLSGSVAQQARNS